MAKSCDAWPAFRITNVTRPCLTVFCERTNEKSLAVTLIVATCVADERAAAAPTTVRARTSAATTERERNLIGGPSSRWGSDDMHRASLPPSRWRMGRSDDRVEGSLVGISAGLRRPTLDVQRMVAGREMAVAVIHERRLQRPADLGRVPAPGMEAGCRAAARRASTARRPSRWWSSSRTSPGVRAHAITLPAPSLAPTAPASSDRSIAVVERASAIARAGGSRRAFPRRGPKRRPFVPRPLRRGRVASRVRCGRLRAVRSAARSRSPGRCPRRRARALRRPRRGDSVTSVAVRVLNDVGQELTGRREDELLLRVTRLVVKIEHQLAGARDSPPVGRSNGARPRARPRRARTGGGRRRLRAAAPTVSASAASARASAGCESVSPASSSSCRAESRFWIA